MRLLGFYPPQKFKKFYRFYAYAVYVSFTIPVPILAAVHLIVGENIDLVQVGESSFIMFQGGCFISKLIPFIFNSEDIRKSIYMLEWPVFNNYSQKQGEIIEKCVKICKRNTWLFLGFCMISFVAWSVMPFFGSVHKFPIKIWLPFEPTSDDKMYVLTYIFIISGVGNGAISNGVIDPLVSGLACFAASQLEILKDDLENLGTEAEQAIGSNCDEENKALYQILKNNIIYSKIGACINHHITIITFIQHYERIYSAVVFTQFMAAVLVICVSCLQLSMSNTLTSAVYMGTWYEFDLKSRKALIILMERSKRPIIITAGKILESSLVTFTAATNGAQFKPVSRLAFPLKSAVYTRNSGGPKTVPCGTLPYYLPTVTHCLTNFYSKKSPSKEGFKQN
ncbi:odorant receptor 33b-like [Zophobas morio]|uniref:odorant receptor 33b-like n=1 Tax=Zophobas morio TaxID=2755281 RepID=UPI0030832010